MKLLASKGRYPVRRLSHLTLAQPTAAGRTLVADERGAAYVEFLVSFLPLFLMFMGMVQISLAFAGDLVVQHAAVRAARAAAVVLDDDPERYDGQDRLDLGNGTGTAEDSLGSVALIVAPLGAVGSLSSAGSPSGGMRMGAIRTAAGAPLMAISPSLSQMLGDESVMDAIGATQERGALGASAYSRSAMAITFPNGQGSSAYRTNFPGGRNTQITTRVTYLFHCGVPLANRILCESYGSLRLGPAGAAAQQIIQSLGDGTLTWDQAQAQLARIQMSAERSERDGEAIDELSEATSGTAEVIRMASMATGARFKVMRGEATMPLQFARYDYPSE